MVKGKIYLKKESTNSYLLKTCRSSSPSPTPIYLTGNLELVTYANHHATFCGSVKFGNGKGSNFGRCGKLFGLFKGILPGRTIQHQEHFMRRIVYHLLHHPFYFGKFIHKVHLIMQTAGGINDHHIGILFYGTLHTESKATEAGSLPIFCFTIGTSTLICPHLQVDRSPLPEKYRQHQAPLFFLLF